MPHNEVDILKRALDRQKKARLTAEKILEEKSKALYDTAEHLKRTNARLNALLDERSDEMDSAFLNIIDPYVIMDLNFEVIKTNDSAKSFLGFDYNKESLNLQELVHPDFAEYTKESTKTLLKVGVLKNYRAKIYTRKNQTKYVQINASLIYNREGHPIAAQGIIRDITQEMEIEALLSEQRKQLDIIVENSPLGIVLSVDGKFIKCNSAMLNMLGYSLNEIKQLSVADISVKEEFATSKRLLEQMGTGNLDHFSINKRYRRKNGSTFMAKTSVSAIRKVDGDIDYRLAIIEDITAELEAQEKLAASESRLALLIKNLDLAVLLEDEKGSIALTNEKFCEMFDIDETPEALIGQNCSETTNRLKKVFPMPVTFEENLDSIHNNRLTVIDDELETKDGRFLERDYIPISSKGNYMGHLWTYKDITLRRTFKQNLQAEKEKYSSIIANMNLGLVEVDKFDKIQMVNQSFCAMSGYSEQELLGQTASELLEYQQMTLINDSSNSVDKKKTASFELKVRHKSGQTRHWLISGAPRYDERHRIIGSIGIHLDITGHKQLELQKAQLLKELQVSNKELHEYAHIVSHDLKSPLRSVSALATWLREDHQDVLDENGFEQIQMIQDKIEGMDNLIDGILKYSSIGRKDHKEIEVNLNHVVKDIMGIIYIPSHVNIEITSPLPTIKADKTKIHQLFQNFLSNAVMHIEKKEGLVQIGCDESNSHWTFSIRDNGVGIPKEYHEKIFKIFQSLGTKDGSTGIGLSIVKKIIDLYEGRVWLESEVGQGTTFYFTIKKHRA
ncbi:PAS domain-containing sensor histidine kinase [Sediminicola luteus]|uniref:histidine kinase n=1 Tax=Sediminicola luteus TaxID=319238 RepID=A0A2A4G457_9FLAO|nr:PAS domain S-box protein [Sediminicola luteus]PCE62525.1 PAS domain-containing sensor histidine kinase [Sediminicola luteus]